MAAEHAMVAPTPRSPPKYPDFGGRRRLQLEVQNLNREVGFLEEEVLSLEGHQPVSRCCKEVHEFVGTNPDPLVPLDKNIHRSCNFWRWLGSKLCCTFSWICCCTGCCDQCKCPCCPNPKNLDCCNCLCCCCPETSPSCRWPCSNCCPNACCPKFSCFSKSPCCCSSWDFSCCKFPKCCCSGDSCSRLVKCCCPPTISCPEYSCGCVLDCPKCTEVHLCPKCSKPCCVTGCLC